MVRRIAVLRALFLGDFLCAEPALRALKARFPLAELTFIGLPWIEPFLRRYACVDHFLAFPGCEGIEEAPYDPAATEAFLARARDMRFDLAIQMHGSGPASNAFVAGLGAPVSLGYTPHGQPGPLTKSVPYPGDSVHEVRKWLGLVAHIGATAAARPQLPVTAEEEQDAERLLQPLDRRRPVVAIHPGARDPRRRWPAERFAALADRLWEAYGCQVVLTGTAEDASLNGAVSGACHAPILDLTGKTEIGCLAALLDRVDLLVTNDTGPSHVAWARGVPSVVLFGPTDPARWAPLDGELHRPVVSPQRDLQQLDISRVWLAASEMLARFHRQRGGA